MDTMTADSTLGNGSQSTDMAFQLLKKGVAGSAARIGRLALPNRRPIDTPNFVASTSRGAVPHVTPDNLAKHTTFGGAYMALEDCELPLTPNVDGLLTLPSL
jgi:queuine tRNA-ribosyltransferase